MILLMHSFSSNQTYRFVRLLVFYSPWAPVVCLLSSWIQTVSSPQRNTEELRCSAPRQKTKLFEEPDLSHDARPERLGWSLGYSFDLDGLAHGTITSSLSYEDFKTQCFYFFLDVCLTLGWGSGGWMCI